MGRDDVSPERWQSLRGKECALRQRWRQGVRPCPGGLFPARPWEPGISSYRSFLSHLSSSSSEKHLCRNLRTLFNAEQMELTHSHKRRQFSSKWRSISGILFLWNSSWGKGPGSKRSSSLHFRSKRRSKGAQNNTRAAGKGWVCYPSLPRDLL